MKRISGDFNVNARIDDSSNGKRESEEYKFLMQKLREIGPVKDLLQREVRLPPFLFYSKCGLIDGVGWKSPSYLR